MVTKKCPNCSKKFKPRHDRDHRCLECYSKSGKRAKRKGYSDEKKFEKWFQKQIDKFGLPYTIHRTPRSGGIKSFETSDYFFKHLPMDSWLNKIHIEKKDRENWSIIQWIKDAEQKEIESGKMRNPIIVVRKPNHSEDYIIMKKELFANIILNLDKLIIDE